MRERTTTAGALIWKTAGVTEVAESVLGGPLTVAKKHTRGYPGIASFLRRREAGTVDSISEAEMIALAKDLIRATAAVDARVGSAPIQIATVRPRESVTLNQPVFPAPSVFLPSDGTWHLGVTFTPDYPFDERKRGVVYTFCEIKNNQTPIPLGDNHFYGNTFERATFIYEGGRVSFDNNKTRNSTLVVVSGMDRTPLSPILHHFSDVEYR